MKRFIELYILVFCPDFLFSFTINAIQFFIFERIAINLIDKVELNDSSKFSFNSLFNLKFQIRND